MRLASQSHSADLYPSPRDYAVLSITTPFAGVLNRLVTAKRGSSTFRASSAGSGGSSGVGASAAAPPRGGNLGRRRVAVGAQGDGIHEVGCTLAR